MRLIRITYGLVWIVRVLLQCGAVCAKKCLDEACKTLLLPSLEVNHQYMLLYTLSRLMSRGVGTSINAIHELVDIRICRLIPDEVWYKHFCSSFRQRDEQTKNIYFHDCSLSVATSHLHKERGAFDKNVFTLVAAIK